MIRLQFTTAAFRYSKNLLRTTNIYVENNMPGMRSRRETIRQGKDWSKGQYAEEKKNKKSKKK